MGIRLKEVSGSSQDETIQEEREELMVSPTGGIPTSRTGHFLKPTVDSIRAVPCLSLSSKPTISDFKKTQFLDWRYPVEKWKTWVDRLLPLHHHTWKKASPWRWFEVPMIEDSEIMGNVQKKGITFDSFAELARKHVDIEAFKAQHSSLEQFTNCVIQTTSTEELYMILTYSRKTRGDGHFSPMAAYHKGRDMLLILDVARYKYPFHWLPKMTIWDAMNEIDKETNETRGFMMVRKKIS
ncbi:Glutathione gamma-glutamylcysteinyltransferase 2 [Camellia lanceoleosa]|uniref:Glutathione gamma-glutamylcysteinyltransferase 2 n=1 Tax=Camellia lanceoleosa TaxID=1840588 RepID=A0ACC0FN00_9ERIC|nr:Glutathione gamma-glutamylcysteinyltransferase 2 [Camellia lanceoleosa]